MSKTPEELANEYAKVTASDIPGEERVIGENPCAKMAFLAGYHAAWIELQQQIQFLESQLQQANTKIMLLEVE